MKLLFYQISYLDYDLKQVFKEKSIEFDTFAWKFANNNHDDAFLDWFEKNVDTRRYDALFSIDYWPLLSHVCQKNNLKYVAWSYDTPPNVVNIEETLGNTVNSVFWFDRTQYEQYKNEGFNNVYYLPLGVNRTRLGALKVSGAEHKKYDTEVSLVGKLYDSDYSFIMSLMSNAYKDYFDTLIDTQGKLFDRYIIDDMITPAMMNEINAYIRECHPEADFVLLKEALTYALASEVTKRERIILLSLCGGRFDTRLYSYQDNQIIKNIKRFPAVDYVTEMPLVFRCSKINLNPAFCMIQSGASLRTLDIMGAGGFLLTRPQQELIEMYKDGEDMVVYRNIPDAVEKCKFYLEHDELREKIAKNGCRKTLEDNSLQDRVDTIFNVVFRKIFH